MTPRRAWIWPPLILSLAGCGGREDTLSPESPQAHTISDLFWVVTGFSAFGFGVIVLLLFLGWWRRERPTLPGGGGEKTATRVVIGLGVVTPIVLLVALFVWSDLFALDSLASPAQGSTALTIEVTGHQFWWEARYPGTQAVTANELHIPTRTRITILARSGDVIHSFWLPRLNRKIDMIPGQTNRLLLQADEPGVYTGHCAEFCGLQHAHMVLEVVAQPRAQFERWLGHEARPATAAAGRDVFLREACADCHQVRGTDAHGTVGPDLTHFASRRMLGAGRAPNDPEHLREWLRDPQHLKPGNKMPNLELPDADWQALQRYLESLK